MGNGAPKLRDLPHTNMSQASLLKVPYSSVSFNGSGEALVIDQFYFFLSLNS